MTANHCARATTLLSCAVDVIDRPPAEALDPLRAAPGTAMFQAPHAARIEAALVPDWILPAMRNRRMRSAAAPIRPRRRTRHSRDPPSPRPLRAKTTSAGGANSRSD